MADDPNATRHDNPLKAVVAALFDRAGGTRHRLEDLAPTSRLDGKVALVTGANSGLGKAVAIGLARQGAKVLMACRGGHPDAGIDVRAESGNRLVEMLEVDLSDLKSVDALIEELKARSQPIDIFIANAGVMPKQARPTEQGLELMFGVNFLAHYVLIQGLLEAGVIPRSRPEPARIVIVSSESHRTQEVDFDRFGAWVDYGMRDGMKQYGHSKLLLCTYAAELARRLAPNDNVDIAVHSLCPGPVRSNMIREAPPWAKALLVPITGVFFNAPERAALPVLHLATSPEIERQTGLYYHMAQAKPMSELASNPDNGARLWKESAALVERLRDKGL